MVPKLTGNAFSMCPPKSHPWKHQESYQEPVQLKSLATLFSPYILLLKILGSYHYAESSQVFVDKKKWWQFFSWKMYSICWATVSWGFYLWRVPYLLVFFHRFRAVDDMQAQIRVYGKVFWTVVMGILNLAMFLASSRPSGLESMYRIWSEMRFYESEAKAIEKHVRILSWMALAVCIPVVTFEITADIVETQMFDEEALFPAMVPFICGFLSEASTIFYIILLSMTFSKLFSILNVRITDQFQKSGSIASLDNFVHNYYLIAQMVAITDRLFNFSLGCYIAYCILWIIFQSYYSFAYASSSYAIFTWIWYVAGVTFSLTVLWASATIPLKARGPQLVIHALPLNRYSTDQQAKILSLQHYIGTTSISLSLFNIHSITRSLLTSIVGFCLTYLFILIQFRANS